MQTISADYVQPRSSADNRARSYRTIEVLPLASAMGAEIRGVDLARPAPEAINEITDAVYHHKMIYFRDQRLTFADQETLTSHFGEYGIDAYSAGIADHPNIQRVLKEADTVSPMIFGGSWHTDSPFLERPPALSLLYGVDIPPFGGDTLWANSALAFATLSDTMKDVLRPLRVHMSGRRILAAMKREAAAGPADPMGSMSLNPAERMLQDGAIHPLVRTHPVTGEQSLYVDESYTVGIAGMSAYEAAPLLEFLVRHITQEIFTCRLRWEKNTFVIWDNRTTLHHAFNDHDGFRREMLRSIVAGEVPV